MNKEYYLLITGIFGIIAAMVLALFMENIWFGFSAAFMISVVYLFFLDKWMINTLHHSGTKKTIRYLVGSLVVLQLFTLGFEKKKSERQHKTLMTIRTVIEGGNAQIEAEQSLLQALHHYHHEADKDNRTIADSFKKATGDRLREDAVLIPAKEKNSPDLDYIVEISAPDSVLVRITSDAAHGINPEFINYGSNKGKYQATAILTPKGVSYEREN